MPTYDGSLTNDPAFVTEIKPAVEAAIQAYNQSFSDNITVTIAFRKDTTISLGQSVTLPITESYSLYRARLAAQLVLTADDNIALGSLPNTTTEPVTMVGTNVVLKRPNARALGFTNAAATQIPDDPGPGGVKYSLFGVVDGIISINTPKCNLDRTSLSTHDDTKYDFLAVVAHEIDEVLGFGSALDGLNNGAPAPATIKADDLFRFNGHYNDYFGNGGPPAVRSYTTDYSPRDLQPFFSIDGGATRLARFNQDQSGDFGDWFSPSPLQAFLNPNPQVQDAFQTPGVAPNLGVELRRLDVLGYTRTAIAPPVVIAPADYAIAEAPTPFEFGLGTISGPGAGPWTVGPWTVTVSWGDGSSDTTTFVNVPGALGNAPVSLGTQSHSYDEGDYVATMTVTAFTGQSAVATFQVNVSDPALIVTGVPVHALDGKAFTGVLVATFTDPGGAEDLSDNANYKATLDWLDPASPATSMGTIVYNTDTKTFYVTGSHTYADVGIYLITVTIRHGNVPVDASATSTATVTDAPLIPASPAAIPSLYNTGLDSNRNPLAAGVADPHYKLVSGAAPVAFVNPAWLPDNGTSRWIGPGAAAPPGYYDYITTFDLTGFDPSTAQLTGKLSSDNEVFDVLLNNQSTGINNGFQDNGQYRFLTPFTIDGGFKPGVNTLVFHTHNDGGDAGFRVELSGGAHAIEGASEDPIFEGAEFRVVVPFKDSGGAEPSASDPSTIGLDYTASIDWGDGFTTTEVVTYASGTGIFTVKSGHTYGEEGNYAITVVVQHDSAPDFITTYIATIFDPSVVATGGFIYNNYRGSPPPWASLLGLSLYQTLATFTDPGGAEPNANDPGPIASHYTATINWEDGTSSAGLISKPNIYGRFRVLGKHEYLNDRSHRFQVTIFHENATSVTVTSQAVRAAWPPAPVVGGVVNITPFPIDTPNPSDPPCQFCPFDIAIEFLEPVVVTETPLLRLNSGGTATYTSGSGTDILIFTYVVGPGDFSPHLDYASTDALILNGGTINDLNGLTTNLTLPAPGAPGSLGANSNFSIDAVAPVVLEYNVLFGSKSYDVIGSSRFYLPWQITGIQVVFSKPIASGDANSLTGLSTTGLSGLGTNTLTWSISTLTLGKFATMLWGNGAHGLKDALGNSLVYGAGFKQNFRVLYGDFTDDGVVTSADLGAIYAATARPYNIFADLNGDNLTNINDAQIVRRRLGTKVS